VTGRAAEEMGVGDQGSGTAASVQAFIPARRGSTRVSNKNLALVGGKPLLAYTIETALQSGVFDRVIVNSEDDEILAAAERYGAAIYRRPLPLASDTTYVIEIIQDMIRGLSMADGAVLGVLFPTCPLRIVDDIREAYRIFRLHGGAAPVVSVTSYEYPIQLALNITAEGRLEPVFPDDYRRSTRHNDHPRMYRANFAIIFNIVHQLKAQGNLIGRRPIPYIMPAERAIDVDDPHQMWLVKTILESSAPSAGNRAGT
jgi:CMP-N-acetylneuraminic acid synthetase